MLLIAFSNTSCSSSEPEVDACENVQCENGGICEDGTCNCPEGISGKNCEVIFDPTQVQALLDSGQTPLTLYDGGISLEMLYGKLYEGGLIFYLNTDSGAGMVAATEDTSEGTEWGCHDSNVDGAYGKAVGTGQANTNAIIANCTSKHGGVIAAKLCDQLSLNSKTDWFLPAQDELNLMHLNLHERGYGGFVADVYWSSTEQSLEFARTQSFGVGGQSAGNKPFRRHARAVRVF